MFMYVIHKLMYKSIFIQLIVLYNKNKIIICERYKILCIMLYYNLLFVTPMIYATEGFYNENKL